MIIDWERYHILNILISAAAFLFLITFKKILVHKFKPSSKKDERVAHDFLLVLVRNTSLIYLLIASVYLGFLDYDSSEKIRNFCDKAFILTSLFQVLIWGRHFIEFSSSRYFSRHDGSEAAAINLFNFIAKLCLFVVIFLLALHNLNVNVTTLVTGLGVGGIAIALAVQNILGDLFASMTIVLDKPFVVGDSINVDNFNGTIEHIGMKTTRLRSVDGEQLIFSNTDLLKSRIRNFKRMNERRVSFTIGVTYETPKEKLQQIPTMIKAAVEKHVQTRFDRSHFTTFADSSLNFETIYWILDSNFTLYRDTHQAICFELFEQFNKEGIGFAYPTQTVYQYTMPTSPIQN
jgi:small-conductance mechanosensitive channel